MKNISSQNNNNYFHVKPESWKWQSPHAKTKSWNNITNRQTSNCLHRTELMTINISMDILRGTFRISFGLLWWKVQTQLAALWTEIRIRSHILRSNVLLFSSPPNTTYSLKIISSIGLTFWGIGLGAGELCQPGQPWAPQPGQSRYLLDSDLIERHANR